MAGAVLVGSVMVAGLVTFLVGAVQWRLDYQRPMPESLVLVHGDRRRWRWIHLWMTAGMLVTFAGLAGFATVLDGTTPRVLGVMAATAYVAGGVCWVVSLAFRVTVVPWAAERLVATGEVPDDFAAYDRWAGILYCIHMLSAYAASAVLGVAVLATDYLPTWLGWAGVGWGAAFGAGLVATRFAGPFNPPFWAHLYTAVVGVVLVVQA